MKIGNKNFVKFLLNCFESVSLQKSKKGLVEFDAIVAFFSMYVLNTEPVSTCLV